MLTLTIINTRPNLCAVPNKVYLLLSLISRYIKYLDRNKQEHGHYKDKVIISWTEGEENSPYL